MSWKFNLKHNLKGGGTGALLAVVIGLVLLLCDFRPGEYLVHLSYNIPFRYRPIHSPQEVVLVYMDDASHIDLKQPYEGAWDRGVHARLLERLTAEQARAVTFDIIFSGPNPNFPEGDARFARAIKANGRVILGADYVPLQEGGHTFARALDEFTDAAAGWGLVQVYQDQDMVVRRHLHVSPYKEDDLYSSLSWELAKVAGAPCTKDPNERYRERWLNYYGPPESLPNVSFKFALETNGYCPAGYFSNKVVVVGAYLKTYASGQRKDEERTPYTAGYSFEPSVDVQATQVLNLIRGDWLTKPGRHTEIIIIIFAGLVFGIGLSRFKPIYAMLVALGGALVVAIITQFIFDKYRVWYSWMIVIVAQIPIALLWSIVYNSVQLYVQNRLFEQSLKMYLSPKLVKKFSSSSADKDILKVGAKKQMLTIMFTDIASFTSISEGLDGDTLADLMNRYFQAAVSDCIHPRDGTIVKYIGDAIFAFWNAPEPQNDHALRGCEAALLFREQPVLEINGKPLITRLGLHTGEANVGNFGSTARVDYTALGENINLASRMESLNKYLGTLNLITGETHALVTGRVLTRHLGRFQLKGFEKAVDVHELIGRMDKAESLRPLHESFAVGVKLFQQKDVSGAEAAFHRTAELFPDDGPTKFYLKFIAELREHPLPEDWEGEVELKEK